MSETCNVFHDEYRDADNHVTYAFRYLLNSDRISATGYDICGPGGTNVFKLFDANDVGKHAFQEEINELDGVQTEWVLVNHSPVTWKEVTNETVPPDTDVKVKVSGNDTTAGHLDEKIIVVNGINSTNPFEKDIVNPSGDEDLRLRFDETKVNHDNLNSPTNNPHNVTFSQAVSADGGTDISASEAETLTDGSNADLLHSHTDTNTDEKVKVSNNDTTPDFLLSKFIAGANITFTEQNDGANEKILVDASGDLSIGLPILQVRKTTSTSYPTIYTDIIFNVKDIASMPTILDRDSINNERILLKELGFYSVSFNFSSEITSQGKFKGRLFKNGTTLVPGSEMFIEDGGDTLKNGNFVFIEATSVNDFFTFQLDKDGGSASVETDIVLTVIKLKGAKGDAGIPGAGSSLVIKDEGTSIPNTPHSEIDFQGAGVVVSDGGSGKAIVTISNTTPIFGSEFQNDESLGQSSTQSTTFQQKLRMTTPNLPLGKYRIGWSYGWSHSNTGDDFEVQIQINDTDTILDHKQETKDPGVDQLQRASGFVYEDNFSGVKDIDVDFRTDDGSTTAYIRDCRLEIWRVS